MKKARHRTAVLFGQKLLLEKKKKIGGVTFELVRVAGGGRGYFIRASAGGGVREGMGFMFGTRACGTPQLAAFAAQDMVRRMFGTLARLMDWEENG